MARRVVLLVLASLVIWSTAGRGQDQPGRSPVIQFVFTSDSHYGITRPAFRGQKDVRAAVVNAALVRTINALPASAFPEDGGLRAGNPIGGFDFVAVGGDVANREETGIQSAAASWAEFTADYVKGLTVKDAAGRRSALYVVPGNHDVSNLVGFPAPMFPLTDAAAYLGIYNMMMRPPSAPAGATITYPRDRVLTARDIGGVHFEFVSIWPDSEVRRWMAADLERVGPSMPVIVFTHDQPEVEAKHFRNPNGAHDINPKDRFENLLADVFTSGTNITAASTNEQRDLERFLRQHSNVTAYFHGNSNWNQFYDWTGPDHSALVHVFRVDSPMKGHFSAPDETQLSFQVAVLDPASRLLTVREALWNATRGADAPAVRWGGSTTVALQPRPAGSSPDTH